MKTESRAIWVFGGAFVLVVAAALIVPHFVRGAAGVEALPVVQRVAPAEPSHAPAGPAKILLTPTLSKTDIAFAHAGQLWIVGRDGGQARRLVTGQQRNI